MFGRRKAGKRRPSPFRRLTKAIIADAERQDVNGRGAELVDRWSRIAKRSGRRVRPGRGHGDEGSVPAGADRLSSG
jgi:hypothetical protein